MDKPTKRMRKAPAYDNEGQVFTPNRYRRMLYEYKARRASAHPCNT
jgi:hypothetical protein